MSQKNKWQKQCEKKLSLENLESRQLLSAVPFTANPDYTDSTAYLATNDDVAVDYTVAEDALAADVQFEDDVEQEQAVTVNANANKLAIEFAAADKEQFTVIVKGTDAAGKETTAFKSVKAAAKNIKDGIFTYNFSGKVDNKYDVTVVKGKYTAKDLAADGGTVPEDRLVGSANVTTLAPFTFVATPNTASPNSITFQQKDGKAIESVEGWTISGKFDGAKKATVYTINDDGELVDGETVTGYSVTLNDEGASVTISGLQLNTKQSFQVAWSTENAVSAFSKNLNISTTKEQKAEPIDVEVENGVFGGQIVDANAKVTWSWEASEGDTSDTTFTVAYTYQNDKGKEVTKVVNKKATVNEEGKGEFVVTKLPASTEVTFTVTANKNKDYDASAATLSDAFKTTAVIPAPSLKKVSVTDTTATFEVTNWDKMEAALQEADSDYGHGGTFVIAKPDYDFNTAGEEGLYAWFESKANDEGAWVWTDEESGATMEITAGKKKNTATITIVGLTANTDYSFQATAFSTAVNDNINFVAGTTSKALKVKTNVSAYPAPEDVEAELVVTDAGAYTGDVAVKWAGENGATYTINYTYTDAKGKEVTKTANKKATVENGEGKYTVTKLPANTKITFSVSANKDKEHSASVFVAAEEAVVTPAVIPAPTLKKSAVTATSVSFQISNWDKMETLLQECAGEEAGGGCIYIKESGAKFEDDPIAVFTYEKDGEGNLGWQFGYGQFEATMVVTEVKKKNVATVTINGLEANKEYKYELTAYNDVQNDNINTVTAATSKAFKIKTAK